jgi:uncharacterized protein YcbK (DUF882 family)
VEDRQLTPHFKLSEFLVHEPEDPSPEILNNLTHLAEALEKVRAIWGKPIQIISGYRSPKHNAQVGGVSGSYHQTGQGADITIEGISSKEVYKKLSNWLGGVGLYPFHVHVDIRPYKARWNGVDK